MTTQSYSMNNVRPLKPGTNKVYTHIRSLSLFPLHVLQMHTPLTLFSFNSLGAFEHDFLVVQSDVHGANKRKSTLCKIQLTEYISTGSSICFTLKCR